MESDPKRTTGAACPKWATEAMADCVVATITLFIGIAMMVDSDRIGAGWGDGHLQSGYFPFRLGAIISIVSLAILLNIFFGKARDNKPFVGHDQFKLVMAVFMPTLIYILATQLVGIYVASAIFIAGFMRVGGNHGWLKMITVSAGTSATLFLLFEIVFLIPLPKGPLEAMLGY